MVKNPKVDNDEINLIELMYTLWEGKWKIAVAVIISLIAVISYQSTKTKNFTAITEIKPVSILEFNKYLELNDLMKIIDVNNEGNVTKKVNQITISRLLDSHINILEDKSIFEDAIRKFNLLEVSQYNNEKEYSEAIIRLASSVKILSPPVNNNVKKGNLEKFYYTINFTHHDAKKWKSILKYVDELANKFVQKNLVDEYSRTLEFLENDKKYKLEDISIKINNKLNDYNREISDRLAYLSEQSAIAKKLGIAKNTIEVQTFGNQNALLSNVKTDSPFYLRGYEAIDKEIELILSRKDKKAFIRELFELEKQKRAIEQDKTIKRLELALQSNPISDNNEFYAASIKAISTKFEYENEITIYAIAIVISLMAGIFYVLISNAFQSFRVSKKN